MSTRSCRPFNCKMKIHLNNLKVEPCGAAAGNPPPVPHSFGSGVTIAERALHCREEAATAHGFKMAAFFWQPIGSFFVIFA